MSKELTAWNKEVPGKTGMYMVAVKESGFSVTEDDGNILTFPAEEYVTSAEYNKFRGMWLHERNGSSYRIKGVGDDSVMIQGWQENTLMFAQ